MSQQSPVSTRARGEGSLKLFCNWRGELRRGLQFPEYHDLCQVPQVCTDVSSCNAEPQKTENCCSSLLFSAPLSLFCCCWIFQPAILPMFYNLHFLIYKARSKSHTSDIFFLPQVHFEEHPVQQAWRKTITNNRIMKIIVGPKIKSIA